MNKRSKDTLIQTQKTESDIAQFQPRFYDHLTKISSFGYLQKQSHDAEGQKFTATIPEKEKLQRNCNVSITAPFI